MADNTYVMQLFTSLGFSINSYSTNTTSSHVHHRLRFSKSSRISNICTATVSLKQKQKPKTFCQTKPLLVHTYLLPSSHFDSTQLRSKLEKKMYDNDTSRYCIKLYNQVLHIRSIFHRWKIAVSHWGAITLYLRTAVKASADYSHRGCLNHVGHRSEEQRAGIGLGLGERRSRKNTKGREGGREKVEEGKKHRNKN